MDFRIIYDITNQNGAHIKRDGEIIVKNCMSVLHAKVKLDSYIQKKNPGAKLIIKSCTENNPFFDLFSKITK